MQVKTLLEIDLCNDLVIIFLVYSQITRGGEIIQHDVQPDVRGVSQGGDL